MLVNCNIDTPKFTLKGDRLCKCVKVYDGDTITVVFQPFSETPFYKFNIRLNGIDTPELRGSSPDEKEKAILARDFLANLILDEIIFIKLGDFDKYGRLLGDIYLSKDDTKSINELMIEKGHAYEYNGGTKKKF